MEISRFMTCKRCESFLKIYVPNHLIKGLDDVSVLKNTFLKGLFDQIIIIIIIGYWSNNNKLLWTPSMGALSCQPHIWLVSTSIIHKFMRLNKVVHVSNSSNLIFHFIEKKSIFKILDTIRLKQWYNYQSDVNIANIVFIYIQYNSSFLK